MSRTGAVVIGRNEGERLLRCLRSLEGSGARIIYVDSGSTDGSVAAARAAGAEVVELSPTIAFTAARARNAGASRLLESAVEYIQFVDGDCEVDRFWLGRAIRALEEDPRLAVVCGRRREIHPEISIYNRLCDIEWDTTPGEVSSCGGDALMRADAFRKVGGFRDSLIAGEEPELCVRLRREGYRIRRLDAEMTRHDAAMHSFGQWFRRHVRAGHAYFEGAALHGAGSERHWVHETRSIVFWAAVLPLAVTGLAFVFPPALVLLLAYPLLVARILLRRWKSLGFRPALSFAVFCVLAKVPQAVGGARFLFGRLAQPSSLIEYK